MLERCVKCPPGGLIGAAARALVGMVLAGGLASVTGGAAVAADTSSMRLVHRFLEAVIAPDGTYVASVEGDSPPGGSPPEIRELVLRRVADGAETRVALPCGRVPQCWPSAPAWSPDSRHLSFALRTPGSHSYAVYDVTPTGTNLTRLLAFGGTITDLKYSSEGTLALLAVENARKEVGATEAGAAIAGDLDAAPAEQRIATLIDGTLRWASPPNLFVYQFDWRPAGAGFVGTAAPGDGDDNWWTAQLYAFAPGGAARVLYRPADLRQQLADPTVSPDGKTVAFIAGIMSDFGSTGGDVYTVSLDSGAATNITPSMRASGTSLAWSCKGTLRAALLAVDQQQIVDLGTGRSPATPRILWSGSETLHGEHAGASWACPSDTLAAAYETYTRPPEIRVGRPGKWRDLTHVNAGMTARSRHAVSSGTMRASTCRAGCCSHSTSRQDSDGDLRARRPRRCRASVVFQAGSSNSLIQEGGRFSIRTRAAVSGRVSASPQPMFAILGMAICGTISPASTPPRPQLRSMRRALV